MPVGDANLLVGFDTSDDACVYKLRDDLAIVQTVDFFPPVVDDPYLFGQIAAANAMSDIYAMGAAPTLALNIFCFPSCLPVSVMKDILRGGSDKVREAGALIAGGHSIDDDVPKYGLCVSGFLHPDALWTNAGAREGDMIILTKPLGSGIINTAVKIDMLTAEQLQPTLDTMAMLNKYARDIAMDYTVHACTDITGFGFVGHTLEMANASGHTIEVFADALPLLPHALSMAEQDIIPGGAARNSEYVAEQVSIASTLPEAKQAILHDPQTSGGLLLCVPAAEAQPLVDALQKSCPQAAIVGRVLARQEKAIIVS